MRQTFWRTIAFVVVIPIAYLLIWTILVIIARASGFSISGAGTFLSVLGSIMGAIFAVGGLVVALVAILTQIQLRDRVERVVEDAKQSVINKFEQELRGEYEKQIKQQVEGMLAFFQATNAHDWKLYASKMIMRPERESKEPRDPCPEQKDYRYGAGPQQESEPTSENAVPDPRAVARKCRGNDYVSRLVARPSRAIQCGWHQDHKQAYTPGITAPSTR